MLAIPVQTTARRVQQSSSAACESASLPPTLSGYQTAPSPSSSTSATASRAAAAAPSTNAFVQSPIRGSSTTQNLLLQRREVALQLLPLRRVRRRVERDPREHAVVALPDCGGGVEPRLRLDRELGE